MASLKSILEAYNKQDLKDFAKQLYIRGISALNKGDLAERIAKELLEPAVMRKRLGVLTDEQMVLFERAEKEAFLPSEPERDDAYQLNQLDYVYLTRGGLLAVADDVKEAYSRLNTTEFHEHRKKAAWLLKCLNFCESFYGIVPIDILRQMYRKKPGYKIDRETLIELFEQIPEDLNWSFIVGEHVVYSLYMDEDRISGLLSMQRDKEFYMPTYCQVEAYWKDSYLADSPAYQKLEAFFQSRPDMTFEEAQDNVREVWYQFEKGDDFGDVLQ